MRTQTGILWSVLFGFLHQNSKILLVASEENLVNSKTETTVPPPTNPTTKKLTSATSAAMAPTTPLPTNISVTAHSPAGSSTPTPSTAGALTTAGPTSGNSTSAASAAATAAAAAATSAAAADPSSITNASSAPATAVSYTASTDPTTLNPSTIKLAPSDSAPTTHAPAGPATTSAAVSAGPTVSVTPNINRSATVHSVSVTLKHDGPAHEGLVPTTNIAAPSTANTQPSPTKKLQDQINTSQSPSLTTEFQPATDKSIIPRMFKETVSFEQIQDPNNEDTNVKFCRLLLDKLAVAGNCSVSGTKVNNDHELTSVSLAVDPSLVKDLYDKIISEKTDPTPVPHTLIAILSSCGALVLILIGFALYCMCHHRSYRKNQQHLTEELQTVENGYHDNPTLEVFEVQPEMQEKKLALNGEFNDSWIVPIDNLAKENIPDEEDTHL